MDEEEFTQVSKKLRVRSPANHPALPHSDVPEKIYIKSTSHPTKSFTTKLILETLAQSHPRLKISTIKLLGTKQSTALIISHQHGAANYLLKEEHLHNVTTKLGTIKVEIHNPTYKQQLHKATSTTTHHVIAKGVPMDIGTEEIEEILKEELKTNNVKAIRLSSTKYGVETTSVRIILESDDRATHLLHHGIQILNLNIRCEIPHERSEQRCMKCQQYGHTNRECRGDLVCRHCGNTNHTVSNCPNTAQPPQCALCQGNHRASYKGCPKYHEAREKERIKRLEEDAKERERQANQKQSNQILLTYSEAVKQHSEQNTKTSEERILNTLTQQFTSALENTFKPLQDILSGLSQVIERTNQLVIANTEAIGKIHSEIALNFQTFSRDVKLLIDKQFTTLKKELIASLSGRHSSLTREARRSQPEPKPS
jgi:hypothetical protein